MGGEGGNIMPLEVHYKNHKAWNGKFEDPEMKKEADQIGHLLMAIGIEELSTKTIDEVIIRKMILDRLYGDATYTLEHYRKIFEKHLGVFIQGRWASTETRWKFVSRHAKGMIHDIEHKVLGDFR
jgi:hypothetical protein|tara:strand:- start:1525 stop:1899 length:375 start_codon:yes stop_codon:yes gene_type:complete